MKKTNGQSRTNHHKRDAIGTNSKKQHRKEANNHGKQPHMTWHNAQSNMMHVRFKEAWHGKVHKQSYKLSGPQYAMSCILTKTPHDLFSSLSLGTQQY